MRTEKRESVPDGPPGKAATAERAVWELLVKAERGTPAGSSTWPDGSIASSSIRSRASRCGLWLLPAGSLPVSASSSSSS